jgi:hypothetical protein
MTSRRKLIAFAVISNLVIIAVCFAIAGWNEAGAGAATRSTARFAIIFFLLGFAAPGLRKWLNRWPEPWVLLQTFVAAQFVHFGAVALLHTVFAVGGFHLGIPQVVVVIVGFSIVAGVGWTAVPEPGRRLRAATHVALIYLIFLILAADYSQHPVKAMRWMTLPLAVAFVARHLPRKNASSRAATNVA